MYAWRGSFTTSFNFENLIQHNLFIFVTSVSQTRAELNVFVDTYLNIARTTSFDLKKNKT